MSASTETVEELVRKTYQHGFVTAVTKAGACFSVGARQDPAVRRAIASIDPESWVRIEYRQSANCVNADRPNCWTAAWC